MSLYKLNWISAATVDGSTASENAEGLTHFTVVAADSSGLSNAAATVYLEGSVEGSNWWTLVSISCGFTTVGHASYHSLATDFFTTPVTTNEVSGGVLVRLIRLRLDVTFASPIVSASLYAI